MSLDSNHDDEAGFLAKPVLVFTLLALMIAGGSGIQVEKASAATSYNCVKQGARWACRWYDTKLKPETRHWFQAANTLRNWDFAGVWDSTNSVAKKCVKIKRASDGMISNVACTHHGAAPDAWIPAGKKPGWLFNIHWAPGRRYIGSTAFH